MTTKSAKNRPSGDTQTSDHTLLSNRKDEIPIVNANAYDKLVPGGQRGNPTFKDQYMFMSFQLEVFLPKNKEAMFKKTN